MVVAARLAVIAAVAALAGCAQVTTGAETVAQLPRKAVEGTANLFEFIFSKPEYAAEVQEVGRLQQCNTSGREPAVTVIGEAAAVEPWQAARGISIAPTDASLSPGSYALVELGERATGGYGIAVSRQAGLRDGVLYLKASFFAPSNASMVTQVLTSPCSLVLLPSASYSRIVLLDQSNRLRAEATAAPLSPPAPPPPSTPEPAAPEPVPAAAPAPG